MPLPLAMLQNENVGNRDTTLQLVNMNEMGPHPVGIAIVFFLGVTSYLGKCDNHML